MKTIQEKVPVFRVLFIFVFFAFAFLNVFIDTVHSATAPSIITYQGKLLDGGTAVDATTTMQFLIYDDPTGGTLRYTAGGTIGVPSTMEVPVESGIFSVNFGGSGTNAVTSSIFANNTALYLEVWVEGQALTPRKRLTSASYAMNSAYLMGYAPATTSTTEYIPLSDANGNITFSGDPQSSAVGGGNVYINPAAAAANETLFGIADNGTERFRVDKEGDAWFSGNLTATGTATSSFTNVLVNDGITLGGQKRTTWPAGGGDVAGADDNEFTGTNTFYDVVNFRGKIATPTPIGDIDTSGAQKVFVAGSYAYISDGDDGLRIIDITNPAVPVLVSTVDVSAFATSETVVAGNYAYLADGGGLSIVDVADPTNPEFLSSVSEVFAQTIVVSGKYAYVGTLFGLDVIDISDPYNPVITDNINLGQQLRGVAVSGKYAYISQEGEGLSIIDITDPYNLVEVGSVDNGVALSVSVSGKYAYLSDNAAGEIDVIDIGDPTAPAVVATFSLSGGDGETPIHSMVSGDYLFVAANSADLAILDISDPLNPVRVGVAGGIVAGDAKGVFVSGNYIYLAENLSGLAIIDITGAKISSARVGTLQAENVDISGDTQFQSGVHIRGGLSVGNSGLIVNGDFSVSNSTSSINATNTLRFSSTALFETNASALDDHAFIFNTRNSFNTTSPSSYLFSIRNSGVPTFSIAANGDVHTTGTYYGAAVAVSTPGAPGDLAERVDIAIDDEVEPGDVVVVDPHATDTYRRSLSPYASEVSGVISTQPSIVVGDGRTEHTAIMAMVGRVPIKVSAENGPVVRGDLLITATSTGYAMRYDSTKDTGNHIAGIVGVALESLPAGKGKIMGLVRTGWINGEYRQTFSEFREELSRLALVQPNIQTDTITVSENSDGTIGRINADLNLNGFSILAVKSIQGMNEKWSIDEEGRFTTTVDTRDGGTKTLYALQTGESQYVFSGSGTLVDGKVRIDFEDSILDIIDTEKPMSINLTLAQKAKGIYVSDRDEEGFDVEEMDGGTSDAAFDWLVFATRKDEVAAVIEELPVLATSTSQSDSDSDSDSDSSSNPVPEVVEDVPVVPPAEEVPVVQEVVSEEVVVEENPVLVEEPVVEVVADVVPEPTAI